MSMPRTFSLNLPGERQLHLGGGKTCIMGILNCTEDSFYSLSRVKSEEACIQRAQTMLEQGAGILDLGAESTRPGSLPAEEKTELERLVPVVRELRSRFPQVVLSIDTTKSAVAQACLEAGADILNDISGLGFDPSMAKVAARWKAPLILMHMRGVPRTMQQNTDYSHFMEELLGYFMERITLAESSGCSREQIIIDPGLGFSKDVSQNLRILREIESFRLFERPILIGHSRKSTIGKVLNLPDPGDRLAGTLGISAWCASRGVEILRVHDVRENLQGVRMIEAILTE